MAIQTSLTHRDAVALILAVGLVSALNIITIAVLYDSIAHERGGILSENATQILTGTFGGIIGILGAMLGYRAGQGDLIRGAKEPPPPGGGGGSDE